MTSWSPQMSPRPEEPRPPLQPLPEGNTRSPDGKLGCKAQGEQSGVRENRAWEREERGVLSVIFIHQQNSPALILQGLQKHPQQPTTPLSNAIFGNRRVFPCCFMPGLCPPLPYSDQSGAAQAAQGLPQAASPVLFCGSHLAAAEMATLKPR